MSFTSRDRRHMQRALELAAQGRGAVEPNPMVGCVIALGDKVLGEGWHKRFGGPHAEVEALRRAGAAAKGSTMYVTLEPCCHHGKTPPCTDAVIAAGVMRVVVAQKDPFPDVAGKGVRLLQRAGCRVQVGLMTEEARDLNAPYLSLIERRRPWVIAKWAMSLDGKIATRTGDSRWISNESSRKVVHEMRGRVDGILVGRRTVELDDPLLTARPAGSRTATRIVIDRRASLASPSQLVRTAGQSPVLVVATDEATEENQCRLVDAGCEVLVCSGATWDDRLTMLLDELGKRRFTNVLVEGGAATLGGFWDAGLIDEVHLFLAPIVIGGSGAPGPVAGEGAERMEDALRLANPRSEQLDGDWHVWGRVKHKVRRRTSQSRRRSARG